MELCRSQAPARSSPAVGQTGAVSGPGPARPDIAAPRASRARRATPETLCAARTAKNGHERGCDRTAERRARGSRSGQDLARLFNGATPAACSRSARVRAS
ncbi:hypothetical protein NX02_p0705 (plasmid) [Sphingomonas sanxanigenens DSM 19645 = NX02]|uniref:Uncharacterized protein n=1 Tax=Sphingomonas sanxanigenens DSM 19645 = NX02 TaxID=1123269 RepID=A0A0F7JT18_9SPHN|nr:hypothetical protein NX02_p0705 [Sphingomonas sanxanigenens DSM 19645 = NX02]